jgi:hypothetical protein
MTQPLLLIPERGGWRKSYLVPTGPIRPNRQRQHWPWFLLGLAIGVVLGSTLATLLLQ